MLLPISAALAVAGGGCSAFGTPQRPPAESAGGCVPLLVPRLTLDEYVASPVHGTPVIVRDIVPPETVESLADELMSVLGAEEVTMQRKTRKDRGGSRSTTAYDIALRDCVGYIMDSRHDDAYFAFCEGLLPPGSSAPGRPPELGDVLGDIREAPFSGGEDWFEHFPSEMRPTDAVVLAGAGATSTLHRDPFEWTGTSLCLEGTKIWRFVLPPTESRGGVAVVDAAFRSYRLDSVAWEEDGDGGRDRLVLSAGWQSDMSLFDAVDVDFPSGFDWATREEEDGDGCLREMEGAATDAARLRPCAGALDALDRVMAETIEPGVGLPTRSPFVVAIQRPGDLLLIPAHCWHQTYAPVPSVAVASLRCGANVDGANVVRHVLDAANRREKKRGAVQDELKRDYYEEGMGEEIVKRLIEYVTMTE